MVRGRADAVHPHTILTTRREDFYWAAVLFTFAVGTAAGDLVAERPNRGYPLSVALFGAHRTRPPRRRGRIRYRTAQRNISCHHHKSQAHVPADR
ncbi:hypothetical protein [Actinomadura mexicana]|uniref:hypothetical protein n=1 Tax=Actinomadura mexicana TaxID=134959 RepID=UPI003CCBDA35